jgi:hypothetical protein
MQSKIVVLYTLIFKEPLSIVIRLWGGWLKNRSSIPGRSKKITLFYTASRPGLRSTQPTINWILGAVSPQVKRQGREADH